MQAIYLYNTTYSQQFIVATTHVVTNCKQPKCSSSGEWLVKVTLLAHPYHGILLSNKKEQAADTLNSLNESPENYAE